MPIHALAFVYPEPHVAVESRSRNAIGKKSRKLLPSANNFKTVVKQH